MQRPLLALRWSDSAKQWDVNTGRTVFLAANGFSARLRVQKMCEPLPR